MKNTSNLEKKQQKNIQDLLYKLKYHIPDSEHKKIKDITNLSELKKFFLENKEYMIRSFNRCSGKKISEDISDTKFLWHCQRKYWIIKWTNINEKVHVILAENYYEFRKNYIV